MIIIVIKNIYCCRDSTYSIYEISQEITEKQKELLKNIEVDNYVYEDENFNTFLDELKNEYKYIDIIDKKPEKYDYYFYNMIC